MAAEQLIQDMQECAEALYQNREQEAYQKLNDMLPAINQVLQEKMGMSKEIETMLLPVVGEFIEDFQKKDNLGLADLLGYTLPDIFKTITENK